MSSERLSDIFSLNYFFWKIFGIWPGKTPSKYYKYYSFIYLFITLVIYNILLTLNLIYTPRKIEYLIREVIFYFIEVVVTGKVLMVLVMRNKLLKLFELMDCEEFCGDDDTGRQIVEKNKKDYKAYWKLLAVISHLSYSAQVLGTAIIYLIWNTDLELPICKYYFLSDEIRDDYFSGWFVYQSFGMYGHMMYNVNLDTFMAGMLLLAIGQLKMIGHKLRNLKIDKSLKLKEEEKERIQMMKLNRCLRHYELILKYCNNIQDIISVIMFVQFSMAATIICVVLCGLLMTQSNSTYVFMVTYLFAITLQIFVPGYLGTQIAYESRELVFAAYNSQWIPRSESFKRSIKLFVERANTPVVMSGLKMFPLSLGTFTSIMKTAYSFFTLVRSIQET